MDIAEKLNTLCINKHVTIATSESCTAGSIASKICSVSGSSFFFAGGIIAYQNRIRENLLTIPNKILNQSDAVSATVAEKMAYNTRVKFGVDFCISSTGFAGPTGGNADFPVGTIFLAISSIEKTISKRLNILSPNRSDFMLQAVNSALSFLYDEIKKQRLK